MVTHFNHGTRLYAALSVMSSTDYVLHTPFYILVHIFLVYSGWHRRWRFYGQRALSSGLSRTHNIISSPCYFVRHFYNEKYNITKNLTAPTIVIVIVWRIRIARFGALFVVPPSR
jgi:hypothetical protein